jgi:DNA-binding transcriptional LysR family regulator
VALGNRARAAEHRGMSELDSEKIKRLDGSLLLVFVELVRHRRTTTAAKRLGLSQSAISHALARLRDLFGDRLFIRRPNGLEPTQRALELAPQIEQLLRLANETLNGGSDFDPSTSRRHFRIGAPDYVCTLLSAPLLQRFEQEAADARFSFRLLVGHDAVEGLKRDEIDVALGRFPNELPEYAVEPLFDETYCMIARRDHSRLRGAIDMQAYLALGHVLVSMASDFVGMNDRVMRKLKVERRVVASVPRFLIALSVVAETDAVATVPRRLAQRYAEQLGLQVLPLPFELDSFSIAAVTRKPADPAIEWLTSHLRASSR